MNVRVVSVVTHRVSEKDLQQGLQRLSLNGRNMAEMPAFVKRLVLCSEPQPGAERELVTVTTWTDRHAYHEWENDPERRPSGPSPWLKPPQAVLFDLVEVLE